MTRALTPQCCFPKLPLALSLSKGECSWFDRLTTSGFLKSSVVAVMSLLASLALAAGGDSPPTGGATVYTRLAGRELVFLDEGGTPRPAMVAEADGRVRGLTAAPGGKILAWSNKGLLREMDARGKETFRLDLSKAEEIGEVSVSWVEPLENGRFLVTAQGFKGQGPKIDASAEDDPQAATAAVMAALQGMEWRVLEVDRQGRVLQKGVMSQAPWCARPFPGEGTGEAPLSGYLAVTQKALIEMDWKAERKRIPVPEGATCMDAVKLANGNYLTALNTTGMGGKGGKKGKSGLVAEIDPDGKIVRSVSHTCPRTVQPLPGGGILVGAG